MAIALTSTPLLRTERLILRGPERGDLPAFTEYMTSAPRMIEQGEAVSPEEAWFGFLTGVGHWQWHGFGFFVLTLHGDNIPLGRVGLLKHSGWQDVELAWHLFEGSEGNGFATEAGQRVRRWALEQHGLSQFVSYIEINNWRSQNVAKRLGATTGGMRAAHDPNAEVWLHTRENFDDAP